MPKQQINKSYHWTWADGQIWLEPRKNLTPSHKIENNNYVLNGATITKIDYKSNYLWHYVTKTVNWMNNLTE